MTETGISLPSAGEIAELPKGAAWVYAHRCTARAREFVTVSEGQAEFNRDLDAMIEATAAAEPGGRGEAMARFMRSDFEALRAVSRERGWVDSTVIPSGWLGKFWPIIRGEKSADHREAELN